MAASENVLGGNALNNDHNSCGKDSCKCDTNGENPMMVQSTIFDAVKSGMLLPVQRFVELQGDAVLQTRDNDGHTPAHWACYGGHIFILQCIIDHKGPINESSNNEIAQRPIHWACVHGHVPIVDLLLQNGVTIDETDQKGVTPLIVACQYGMTMLAAYLIGKGAGLQLVDSDGDSALHWAAFKGHSELMRLLIYSGLSPHQKDKYGQAPIHLACINGSITAVKELRQQENVAIDEADMNTKTPLMLAAGRKHYTVIKYLKDEMNMKSGFGFGFLPKLDMWAILFGPPGSQKGAMMFFIINMLCWGYPIYFIKVLPATYELTNLHIFFIFVNVLMWVTLYKAVTMDPGFVPTNVPEYHHAVKQVSHCTDWQEIQERLGRLCHTCRTVKPLRSKHCRTCNRCVVTFDHHCPYIYNCVGYNNRVWFILFVWMVSTTMQCAIYMAFYILMNLGNDVLLFIGLVETIFFAIISHIILFFGIYQAGVNLTTNERINWMRYTYLQDGVGRFYNPFSLGCKANILEFLHLRKPLTESDVTFLNVKVV